MEFGWPISLPSEIYHFGDWASGEISLNVLVTYYLVSTSHSLVVGSITVFFPKFLCQRAPGGLHYPWNTACTRSKGRLEMVCSGFSGPQ